MQITFFMRTSSYPGRADKSAMGAINRPLRFPWIERMHHLVDMLQYAHRLFVTEEKQRKGHEDTTLDLTRFRTITGRR